MRSAKWVSLPLLFGAVLYGGTTLLSAQEQREEPKPEARPEAAQPAHPAERQNDAKPEERNRAEKEKTEKEKNDRQEDRPAKPENDKERMQTEHNDKQTMQQDRKEESAERRQGSNDHRGGKIPEEKFRSNFGRQHTFVVHQPTVVEGRPRFQYSGYYFTIADEWPAGWDYADQCYIDDVNGEYFLFDLAHPGVSLALVVVM